eukprot:13118378-Alexandrium_andersonii.AAC.1
MRRLGRVRRVRWGPEESRWIRRSLGQLQNGSGDSEEVREGSEFGDFGELEGVRGVGSLGRSWEGSGVRMGWDGLGRVQMGFGGVRRRSKGSDKSRRRLGFDGGSKGFKGAQKRFGGAGEGPEEYRKCSEAMGKVRMVQSSEES